MRADSILYDFFARKKDVHKGNCGRVCVIAGSFEMTGGALLCAEAALRTGAGLVYMVAPAGLIPVYETVLREAVFYPLGSRTDTFYKPEFAEEAIRFAKTCDSVVIGPGLGRRSETVEFVLRFLDGYSGKIVVDADGLYALSAEGRERCGIMPAGNRFNRNAVMTPHEGEASRLLETTVEYISGNREMACRAGAEKYGCVFLLKGHKTLISGNGNYYENNTGNAGMATAGSGDVLSGIIGGLLVRKDPFEAAVAGAYLHGKTGDCCRDELGMAFMTSGDMVKYLYKAIKPYETVRE